MADLTAVQAGEIAKAELDRKVRILASFFAEQRMCPDRPTCPSCNNMIGYSSDIGCVMLARNTLTRMDQGDLQ